MGVIFHEVMSRLRRNFLLQGKKWAKRSAVFVGLCVLVYICVGAIVSLESNPLEITKESYDCGSGGCYYRITVKNLTNNDVSGYARFNAFVLAGAGKYASLKQAGTERIEFTVEAGKSKYVYGKFKSELHLHSLKTHVGAASEKI